MKLFEPFLEERGRWFLFLPVFMGLGVTLYFAWPAEPPLWPAALLILLSSITAYFTRKSLFQVLPLALLAVALGHGAAIIETGLIAQPMLKEPVEQRYVTGRTMVIQNLPEGYRLYLEDVTVEGLLKNETPRTVRVKIRYQEETPRPGDWVSVRASLFPLSGPVEPGGFNFRRYGFYQGYGGTGYALGKWRVGEGPPPGFLQRGALFFENIRVFIAGKVLNGEKTRENAVATALITGDQNSIDKNTLLAMRISGISHILSVSGLHIALVAGIVFYFLRALMALVPWLALHWPIKKIAAFAAILATLFYTLMCAAPVPAVRSMLMGGMVLIAVMVDRRALSMRMIAFAALVTLLFAPSSLLDPSFQLSFGAVMALIAVFEKHELKLFRLFMNAGIVGKIRLYLIASVLTSIIASAATAPVILYHFQQVNWYGVLTNLIAVPLASFIIMPAAVAAVLAMPFGLESWPLWVMREGVGWMLDSAAFVARLPGSVTYHPAMPPYALALIGFGGLWLCLWRKSWRFLGLIPLILGTLSFLITPRPDVLVADDAVTVAARMDDGRLTVRAKNIEDFTVQSWVQRDGFARDNRTHIVNWLDLAESGGQGPLSCEGYDCVYTRNGKKIGFPMSAAAAQRLCQTANVLVMPFSSPLCPEKTLINAEATRAQGAMSMRITQAGKLLMRSAQRAGEKRPWD